MGLTLSDAFRLLVKRIAAERALPFEPLVPNEKTIATMREARSGKLPLKNFKCGRLRSNCSATPAHLAAKTVTASTPNP
jgi:addiction module RelB/DinJ family antitoxin